MYITIVVIGPLRSGRPRGPWKAFKNVGGEARPQICGFFRAPGASQTLTTY